MRLDDYAGLVLLADIRIALKESAWRWCSICICPTCISLKQVSAANFSDMAVKDNGGDVAFTSQALRKTYRFRRSDIERHVFGKVGL